MTLTRGSKKHQISRLTKEVIMKKVFLIALCVALLCCVSVPLTHAAEQPIKLKYSNYLPPTHPFTTLGQQFCGEIKKRTNGKVEITYFPGGILTSATKVYDGVLNGVSDIGLSHIGYTRGRFLATETLDLPVGYASGYVATQVKDDFYNKFKPKEWNDVHVLHFFAPGPQIIATKTKPVKKLEDLKGLKIRGAGRIGDTVKALGAIPVPVEMTDAYDGLSRGVVDGILDAMETWKGWKLAELVRHATLSQQGAGLVFTFYVIMNKDKWNALPDDVKQVFTQVSAEWKDKYGLISNQIDIAGRDFFKEKGGQIYALSDEETKKWQKAVEPMLAQHVKDLEAKGFKKSDTEAYLKYIRERIDYWSKQEKDRKIPSAHQ
jgi:TRAP-type C4-dicarboxylate transport system substrate-binding protein